MSDLGIYKAAVIAIGTLVPVWACAQDSLSSPAAPSTQVATTMLRPIDAETHTPILILTRRELARLGDVGLGELLQRLPVMGKSAPGLQSNAAGDGAVVADIAGMGPSRCIVLLNGRRLPANELLGTAAVDLDIIPVASLDRVEIFLGGASPAWGADAVSGVINLITRADTQGTDITAAGALTSHQDGDIERLSVHKGQVFSTGHFNVGAELRMQSPIDSSARDFSARSEALGCAGCVWPAGSTATPNGFFSIPAGNALGLPAGYYTLSSGQWRPFQGSGSTNDLYSTQTGTFLRDGRRGGSLTAGLGLDLSEHTAFSLDLLLAKDRVQRQLPPSPVTSILDAPIFFPSAQFSLAGGMPLLQPPNIGVAADNFYNPFKVVLGDVRLRLTGLGPRRLIDDSDTEVLSVSLRHSGAHWEWEGTVSAGRSAISETGSGLIDNDHLGLALGPSGPDANGAIRCGTPDSVTGIVTAPIEGCVPLDVFHGQSSITPEMLQYLDSSSSHGARETTLQLSLLGRSSFTLVPGTAPVHLAVGLESWRATLRSDQDASGVGGPVAGTVQENDFLMEASWPWNLSRTGSASIRLTAGGRVAWGEHQRPVPVGFLGLEWRPDSHWLLRGHFTQVYRAPTVGELYLGFQERILPLGNPCAASGATPPLCALPNALQGVGLDGPGASPATQADYFIAGNPQLRPERGYSAATGLVWSSTTDPGRRVSLDFTWIHLSDAIRQPSALEIISACQTGAAPGACLLVRASPGANLYAIDGTYINGGRDDAARVDLRAGERLQTGIGAFRGQVQAGYLLSRSITDISGRELNLRGTFDAGQGVSGTAYPLLLGRAQLDWQQGAWAAHWTFDWIGSYRETFDRNGLLSPATGAMRTVGGTAYHDFSIEHAWSSLSARFGVENLLDRRPPRVNSALENNTDSGTYRLEGRTYSLTLEMTF